MKTSRYDFYTQTALRLFCLVLAVSLMGNSAQACDGVWKLDPINGDWNNAANWSDGCVPNGPCDDTHFGVSHSTDITVTEGATVFNMAFNSGASAYTFTLPANQHFTFNTDGIHNDSGVVQCFDVLAGNTTDNITDITFADESSAGTDTIFTNYGASVSDGANPGFTQFIFRANAGSATLVNNGGVVGGAKGGEVDFINTAQAANATITNKAGTVEGALGGRTLFWSVSSAADSQITAEGAEVSGAEG